MLRAVLPICLNMGVILQQEALVSVCITSYNYGHYIREAIESALAQTYPHIEVVVSDNASTDDTHHILESYAHDPRVQVYINEENFGLCKNHNLAIERAHGEYIVVLSADDLLFPEHVDCLLRRLLDPIDPVRIAYGQALSLNEHGQALGPLAAFGSVPLAHSHRDDFGNILFFYHHQYPAKLIARSVYDEVGVFNEDVINLIDIEISARMEEADIPTAFVPTFVAGLRSHDNRTSARARDLTNIWIHDKLHMIETGLRPQNAWRIEGYEALILSIVDLELCRLAEQKAEPLNAHECARLDHVRTCFAELIQQTPEWPETEPQLSVVVLSEGYIALLQVTLEAIAMQRLERIEIIVVQNSGCDVQPWISSLPLANRIRVVQARACGSPAHAFRYGLELARGEYVTYLSEGQRVGDQHYNTIKRYARDAAAQMVLVPKSSVDDAHQLLTLRELHPQQFPEPAERAKTRMEAPEYASFCQFFHRRAILRGGSNFYDLMTKENEEIFLATMANAHRTVTLSA